MRRQQVVVGAIAAASVALATACDQATSPFGPQGAEATPNTPSIARNDVVSAVGPGPLLSAVGSAVCADVAGGTDVAPAAGAPVVAWACHGGGNQKFALQSSGAITAYGGARCLDVWGAVANDGDPVVAWTCHGGANQKWTRTAAGELRSAVNGKCLDLWGARGENGAKLVVWSCHGGTNQKWTVNDATAPVVVVPNPAQAFDSVLTPAVGAASQVTAAAGTAELPRKTVDTRMPTPTGRTISVAAGGNLQAALDAAQPGDVVALAPGATFTGNFVLRPKAGMTATQWITVRSAGTLPAEGTRVGPGDATQMPKIVTPNFGPALKTDPGAQGWRLTGLDVGAQAGVPGVSALVIFGSTGTEQNTLAQVPSRLVLDRSYVHASPTLDIRRCVLLNSATSAVVDSYVSECHSRNGDSQAILGWNGPGPFKIANNHLEGGHEVIAFGGADPDVANLVPSDIEITRNHVTRPLSWKGVWTAKNLVEFKAGQRVLLEGNVFENSWADGQPYAFMFWSVNAEGRAPWTVTQDITFRYNRVRNIANGFNLARAGANPSPPLARVTIAHNTIMGENGGRVNVFVQVLGAVPDITVANNTALVAWQEFQASELNDAALPNLLYRNNVTTGGTAPFGTPGGPGAWALTFLKLPTSAVAGNVFATPDQRQPIPGNTYAPSAAAVGFANAAGGDLTLTSASPYRAAGVGGTVPGADQARLAQMTSGVAP